MKYYYIITYGCQMNAHESEKLARIFRDKGYEAAESAEQADFVLFNTCAIRENAEQKLFGNVGAIKSLKRKRPSLRIGVCGCMTQQQGAADSLIERYPFVDLVFGTHNIDAFGSYLDLLNSRKGRVIEVWEKEAAINEDIGYYRTDRVQAYVNINYGCNNFCSYCIVPYVRGRERSRSIPAVLGEVEGLLASGYKEITLLGQNVNSYGNDWGGKDSFSALLKEISRLTGKFQLRFMTNHPKDLTRSVVECVASDSRFCHAIHLPVQSGSNAVLSRMNRKYTREDYLSRVAMIREILPDVALTTDMMVGFPGETEEDFADTLSLAELCRFHSAFTFVYSRRRGTVADAMQDQVPEEVKTERIKRLVALQKEIASSVAKEYYQNKTFEVLFEAADTRDPSRITGRTGAGRLVSVKGDPSLIGTFGHVRVTKAGANSLFGELTEV